MSALLERIRSDVSLLPVEEQQALAVDLLDSSWGAYETAIDVESAWAVEIATRAEEIRTGKASLVQWSAVEADLAKEFGWPQ